MGGVDDPSRRRFLAGAAGLVGGGLVVATARDLVLAQAGAASPQPTIKPRSAWGDGLKPKGSLEAERPEDVRFLLVHHTAGANGYAQAEVRQTLRGIFDYHTGQAKGWPDVAYNFFVDAFGGIWEGRQGSLTQPIKGSATGGSQGFALLCCFIGDHQKTPPTAAAQTAMADLLAWLAGRYAIDLSPGARATFASRGSNLHPAGMTVVTPTIAAHRDMSKTTCPGDACYKLVKGPLALAAATKAGASGAPIAPSPTVGAADPAPPTLPADPDPSAPPSSLPPASPTQVEEDSPPPPAATTLVLPGAGDVDGGEGVATGRLIGLSGLGAAAILAGAVIFRRRRSRADAESCWHSSELLHPVDGGAPLAPDPRGSSGPPPEAAPVRPHPHRLEG